MWLLQSTRVGKLLLAVIHDPEVSRAMGIDVNRYYLITFTFGSLLAALAGANARNNREQKGRHEGEHAGRYGGDGHASSHRAS
jgi:branched-subunit amino acid ABC-type transport system permease component